MIKMSRTVKSNIVVVYCIIVIGETRTKATRPINSVCTLVFRVTFFDR